MKEENVERSLEELRLEGEFEGEGSFTVNTARAASALQEFMLENPRSYVLNAFSHALAAGAGRVELYKDLDDFKLFHDGDTMSAQQLESLLSLNVDHEQERPTWELSVALRGAQALKPKWITVTSGGSCLRIENEDFTVEPCETVTEGTELHVKEAVSFKDYFRARSEEHLLLRTRCCFAPVVMSINKEDMRRSWLPPSGLVGEWFSGDGLPERERLESRFELPLKKSEHDHFSGLVYFKAQASKPETSLTIVLNGILFEQSVDIGWPGSGAVLFCSHLNKDLSHSGLVRDGEFLRMLKFVKTSLDGLSCFASQRWDALSPSSQGKRLDLLERALERFQSAEQWDKALKAREHSVNFYRREKGEGHSETRVQRKLLAQALVRNGQTFEAAKLLEDEALRAGQEGDFQAQLELWNELRHLSEQGVELSRESNLAMWRGLALALAHAGMPAESTQSLEKLSEFLKNEPDGGDALGRLKLELEMVTPERKLSTPQCTQCGGTRLMTDCPLVGREGATIHVRVGEPTSIWVKSELDAPLLATVCGDCGNVSFRVEDPQSLWKKRDR